MFPLTTLVFFLSIFFTQMFIIAWIAEYYTKLVEKAVYITMIQLILSILWSWLFYLLH